MPWTVPTNDGGTLPGSTTWHDLCLWMRNLECPPDDATPSILDYVRSKWITNAAHGLRISGEDRTAASRWRTQKATEWNVKDGSESVRPTLEQLEGQTQLSNTTRIQEEMAAIEAQENIDVMRNQTAADDLLLRTNHASLEFYNATKANLERIFADDEETQNQAKMSKKDVEKILLPHTETTEMQNILIKLKEDVIHNDLPSFDGEDDTIVHGPCQPSIPIDTGTRLSDKLNEKQREIWQQVADYIQEEKDFREERRTEQPKQLLLLVHGGPGTGKSFLAECIHEAAVEQGLETGCMAPTGNAASKLPNGRTAHNFCGIPMIRSHLIFLEKLNLAKLFTLQNHAQKEKLVVLIIDEISFVGPEFFAQIEFCMRQIMGNNKPFGGIAVIIMGDFFQLPPVAPAQTLYAALLKMIAEKINPKEKNTGPAIQGARVFAHFRKIELTQQMRAANDPLHMEFLNRLRSTSTEPHLTPMDTIERLKVISKRDVQKDPSWENAPIVVTSNAERYRINEQKSLTLAKKKNCPRIIWFQPVLGIVASGLDINQVNYIYATNPQFKGVFVAGAPGYLIQNINPKRRLTNGTPITFHSLVLDNRENKEAIENAMKNGFGDDIILQYNPKYVLVKIKDAQPLDFIGRTAVVNEAVIPLAQAHTSKNFFLEVPGKDGKYKLQTRGYGVDLGYSVTLHKIQGQTCDKLIVDLNDRPFLPKVSYHGFYVAVSRVRRNEDLRIMPIQPGKADLKYLTRLQPPKQLITWLNCYDSQGKFDSRKVPLPQPPQTKQGPKRKTPATPTKKTDKKKTSTQYSPRQGKIIIYGIT